MTARLLNLKGPYATFTLKPFRLKDIRDYKSFHPKTRKAWREWLQKNNSTSPGVWMIYYKTGTGKRKFSQAEAVEEALCFGWIDSIAQKLDDDRTKQKFTPRKSTSVWSKINKGRVEKLIAQNLMTDAGLEKIAEAKKNGSWNALDAADQYTEINSMPPDLKKAIAKNRIAMKNFLAFPASYRKRFLFWIDSEKSEATRQARIAQTILMAAANKKPGAGGFKL